MLVVQRGHCGQFPNSDNVSHHVYSFSPSEVVRARRSTRATLYPPVVFDKPGIVVLGCNIHDSMLGYILVVDTPHFAVTNEQGVALIDGVPNGDYIVEAWTPRVRAEALPAPQRVAVAAASVAAEIRITGAFGACSRARRRQPDMGSLLMLRRATLLLAALAAAPASPFADYQGASAQSDRHEFYFDASAGYVSTSTDLAAWTDGGARQAAL